MDIDTAARRWRSWLGAALVAVPIAGYFALLSTASVEVPYLDDYDAVVDFLLRTLDEDTASARLGRLLLLHNEHPMLTLRVAVLGTFAITGGINFGALNALGGLLLVGLLAAMFAASTPDTPPAERLLPFAPAALFLIQPQYWMVLLSATTSLSSVAVTTWAAVTFVALERDGPLARAIAILTAAIATFSLANGILVPWLGAGVLLLRGRPRAARMMAGLGLVLTAAFAAIVTESPAPNLAAVLASPVRLILYILNFVGGSAGFSRFGWSAVCGALLLTSAGFLVWQGLPRRRPALFALLLFILGSIGLNAMARAQQGAGAPLLQPRYSFYGAVILATTYLGWAEILRRRRFAQRAFGATLAIAVVFSLASFTIHQPDVMRQSRRLDDGLDDWLTRGYSGLLHLDFRKASQLLIKAYDRRLLVPPRRWFKQYAGEAIQTELPAVGRSIRMRIESVYQDDDLAFVSGWAFSGGTARNQEVEIVLRSPRAIRVFSAYEVPRADLTHLEPERMASVYGSGFRAVVSKRRVPPGEYRIGILVRRGSHAWLRFSNRKIYVEKRS